MLWGVHFFVKLQSELSIIAISILNLRTSLILENEQSEKLRIMYPFLDMWAPTTISFFYLLNIVQMGSSVVFSVVAFLHM